MNKIEYAHSIIDSKLNISCSRAVGMAPSNIALCKYWGKQDEELHIPITDSISIGLGDLGAKCVIEINTQQDCYYLNGAKMPNKSIFYRRLHAFLDLFRPSPKLHFTVHSTMNIPMAAGVASSACGFAAVTEALNKLFFWQLSKKSLSQLSRLGSGSACRSHWPGFVHWHKGTQTNGLDCYAESIISDWQEIRIGLLLINQSSKKISSRDAMRNCQQTSPEYATWITASQIVLRQITAAIANKDLRMLGTAAQSHAELMHRIMHAAWPKIDYDNETSIQIKRSILTMQSKGTPIFYTQDAGHHIKLIGTEEIITQIMQQYPGAKIVNPWQCISTSNELRLEDALC